MDISEKALKIEEELLDRLFYIPGYMDKGTDSPLFIARMLLVPGIFLGFSKEQYCWQKNHPEIAGEPRKVGIYQAYYVEAAKLAGYCVLAEYILKMLAGN